MATKVRTGFSIGSDGNVRFGHADRDLMTEPLGYDTMDDAQRAFLAQHGFVNDPVTEELDGTDRVLKTLREAGLRFEEHPDGSLTINGRRVRFLGVE